MATGYIHVAAYKELSGKTWLDGWQWLYILAFIITVPISLYGIFTLSGLPETTKPYSSDGNIFSKMFTEYKFRPQMNEN